jgi:thymidylate synthase (FAD)
VRPQSPGGDELLNRYFPVLDHGFIALVDYMGTDECIERAARTSFGPDARKVHERRGLIRYLRRHLHTTPSEMVELKFHCAMPIFVARQWIRHRTANVNEMSGRYSLLPMLFYMPEHENLRTQSTTNRQGRSEQTLEHERYLDAKARWVHTRATAQENYEWLVAQDVAKELARIDLPVSTYTQWYWKIDLHNLCHFLKLRVDSHAQFEVRVYAEIMAAMLQRVAPLSYEAWVDYDVAGARFSRMELEVIHEMLATNDLLGLTLEKAVDRFGLAGRELEEFSRKLEPRETPKFELDLSTAKDGEFFAQKYSEAAPTT